MFRRMVHLLAAALLVCLLPFQNCVAADNTWVLVPVLFATDRESASPEKLIFSEEQMLHPNVTYGLETIVFEPPTIADVTDARRMGWDTFSKDAAKPNWRESLVNTRLDKNAFFEKVKELRDKSPNGQIALFVHGCCIDHHEAMVSAARVAVWYGMPVVAYDWTSPTMKVNLVTDNNYTPNEDSNKESEDRLADFIADLEKVCPASSITIVAHSMGNRLVGTALKARAHSMVSGGSKPKFKEVHLASADIPVELFASRKNYFQENAGKVFVYVNNSDHALSWSYKIHKKYRLGAPHEKLELLLNTPDIFVVDHEQLTGKDHGAPYWLMSYIFKNDDVPATSNVRLIKKANNFTVAIPETK